LARISYEEAYRGIELLPSSRNWWAWLKGTAPECIHVGDECNWIATLLPDTLYLRGKRSAKREPPRPEITLCRECLSDAVTTELESFAGRVVAFEPDAEIFTQYFFVAQPDFEPVGLKPEVSRAITQRLAQPGGACAQCGGARICTPRTRGSEPHRTLHFLGHSPRRRQHRCRALQLLRDFPDTRLRSLLP